MTRLALRRQLRPRIALIRPLIDRIASDDAKSSPKRVRRGRQQEMRPNLNRATPKATIGTNVLRTKLLRMW